jgi:uncharacterized SAM-binding protein YcdF (DUF218 family)
MLKRIFLKKWVQFLSVAFLLFFLSIIFHRSILRGMGNFLIKEDAVEKCDAIVVLSGNALDRATEAALLYKQGIATQIICTGGNQTGDFEILHLKEKESDISKIRLLQMGIPDSVITVLHQGTSTIEEGQVMLDYCKTHQLKSCMIVSSKFHTRRINFVFDKKFKSSSVKILVHGASPLKYDLHQWWKGEDGLLAVYDEYIKLIFYHLKYQ